MALLVTLKVSHVCNTLHNKGFYFLYDLLISSSGTPFALAILASKEFVRRCSESKAGIFNTADNIAIDIIKAANRIKGYRSSICLMF
ncbi:hypothetical protein GCM10027051_35920 [Niabella terrae]